MVDRHQVRWGFVPHPALLFLPSVRFLLLQRRMLMATFICAALLSLIACKLVQVWTSPRVGRFCAACLHEWRASSNQPGDVCPHCSESWGIIQY